MSKPDPAAVFAALGDPTRLALVMTLSDRRARSIATLSVGADISRQAVTKHLRVLETAGAVASERSGRESLFVARREALDAARDYLEAVSLNWERALARLAAHVENDAQMSGDGS